MKGSHLFNMLSALSRPERKQLLYKCSTSDDKRHDYLSFLLKESAVSLEIFQQKIDSLSNQFLSSKSIVEKDKTLRRFLSFAVNEIENLKINNYLKQNHKMRNYILTEISQNENLSEPFKNYVNKTIVYSKEDKDYYLHSVCLDFQIRQSAKSQKIKELFQIKDLCLSKNELLKTFYNQKLSESFNLLSGLYLDNTNIFTEIKNSIPDEKEFDALVEISKGKSYAVDYRIAQARFNYNSTLKFNKLISSAEQLMKVCSDSQHNKDIVNRRLNNLKAVVGFHQGCKIKELINYISIVVEINHKYKFHDSIGFWYYLFFLTLDGQLQKVATEIKENEKYYFNEENMFLKQFIDALILDKQEAFSDSLKLVKDLAYSSNYYIALWSKFLEFKIHYLKGNFVFCETLIERTTRFLSKNKNKPFTYEASKLILTLYKRLLEADPNNKNIVLPDDIPLSPYHQHLLNWVRLQNDNKFLTN